MPLLRMKDASFVNPAVCVGPIAADLEPGERAALTFALAEEAKIAALLAAGIAKASSGCVLLGDFDPRVQSVAAKRIAAFVPHEPLHLDDAGFARYVAYRAALWNVELPAARLRAYALRERLNGMHEAFAYPLIGALIGMPRVVVLDRPQPAYASQILEATAGLALLSTHTQAASARAFDAVTERVR